MAKYYDPSKADKECPFCDTLEKNNIELFKDFLTDNVLKYGTCCILFDTYSADGKFFLDNTKVSYCPVCGKKF